MRRWRRRLTAFLDTLDERIRDSTIDLLDSLLGLLGSCLLDVGSSSEEPSSRKGEGFA